MDGWMDGWMDGGVGGWMDGWMGGIAGLRIAYSSQKTHLTQCITQIETFVVKSNSLLVFFAILL